MHPPCSARAEGRAGTQRCSADICGLGGVGAASGRAGVQGAGFWVCRLWGTQPFPGRGVCSAPPRRKLLKAVLQAMCTLTLPLCFVIQPGMALCHEMAHEGNAWHCSKTGSTTGERPGDVCLREVVTGGRQPNVDGTPA